LSTRTVRAQIWRRRELVRGRSGDARRAHCATMLQVQTLERSSPRANAARPDPAGRG
jgi:hypothetical protein